MIDERRVGLSRIAAGATRGAYTDQNLLRALIRQACISAGLGRADSTVPFADIIEPGAVVLLKPNWVLHWNQSGAGMDCMVTHPAFVLAALQEVVAARPGHVLIADAPIQGADFNLLATEDWRRHVQEVAGKTPVDVLDLRNAVATHIRGVLVTNEGRRAPTRSVLFDLGRDSLLEAISTPAGQFRNTSYNPDDMARVQAPGVHKFCLCKEPFEADVVLSLPKLKAHAKAGITAALKNVVGLNADKNFLPHHRVGGSTLGGDCYEGLKPFKRLAEFFLDQANRRIGRPSYLALMCAARSANALHGGNLEGKWEGNDTTWRMVLDLNRILIYGDASGVMYETPQRKIFSLTDAIVAGDRNGPLAPEPAALGAVTFATNPVHADVAHLALMGVDRGRVPLVREAFGRMRWPLVQDLSATEVRLHGDTMTPEETTAIAGLPFRAPDGWRFHGPAERGIVRQRKRG